MAGRGRRSCQLSAISASADRACDSRLSRGGAFWDKVRSPDRRRDAGFSTRIADAVLSSRSRTISFLRADAHRGDARAWPLRGHKLFMRTHLSGIASRLDWANLARRSGVRFPMAVETRRWCSRSAGCAALFSPKDYRDRRIFGCAGSDSGMPIIVGLPDWGSALCPPAATAPFRGDRGEPEPGRGSSLAWFRANRTRRWRKFCACGRLAGFETMEPG